MTELDLRPLCYQVLNIARQAGEEILKIYNTSFNVELKSDQTPVTEADLVADRLIHQLLNQLTPDIPVLSEEADSIPFSIRRQWTRYWLVDPLDGTREFIKRNDEFTVNIALIDNHCSILGVINAPALKLDYFAWKKGGAHKVQQMEAEQSIHCRKADPEQLVIAGSRSHASNKLRGFLDNLGNVELLSMGSSLKSCLVAEGEADVYARLGPTSEWDTAAAQCIVEEAGGQIRQSDMSPMRYNTKDSLLNPDFFVFGDDSINWAEFLD
ncbi:MAG: 3'(2'),5'-bisphosphate nucleotidase CysQ [Gammaproteobacteria bacterium]|nr:3'(2'),5'-bisphosphate nucleotidase CysQ [Gammaproteobacteria bacterium]